MWGFVFSLTHHGSEIIFTEQSVAAGADLETRTILERCSEITWAYRNGTDQEAPDAKRGIRL
jgi:hypothetical protein